MRKGALLTIVFVAASFLVGIPAAVAATDGSCASGITGDFNGDGYNDLAVGIPRYDIHGQADAGAVNVLYGSASGLTASGSQLWFQGPAGTLGAGDLQGTPEKGDQFGSCLAAGDFDGDGKSDLAVSVPFDTVGSVVHAGAVQVIYGGASGLHSASNQYWTQDTPAILDQSEKGDRFGAALAAGDFDGNGKSDLAIGVPLESFGSVTQGGAVNVIYGTASGLNASGNQLWEQGQDGVQGHAESLDKFGSALAAGDFNAVGRDALAIGVPGEDIYQSTHNEGVVQVLYSNSTSGLSATGNQLWFEDTPGIPSRSKDNDNFGASLATGDFNQDTFDDLAIGVPFKDAGGAFDSGAVHVLYGSATKLDTTNTQFFRQGKDGVPGSAEDDDHYGATLSTADFNGDGFVDLAVGVPLEDIAATADGAVNVIYGAGTGLDTTGTPTQLWHQGKNNAGEVGENGDNFGSALATGDFDGDGFGDLAIGTPREDHAGAQDIGAVFVLYGATGNGLNNTGHQIWYQDFPGVAGPQQINSLWGSALG